MKKETKEDDFFISSLKGERIHSIVRNNCWNKFIVTKKKKKKKLVHHMTSTHSLTFLYY